MATQQPPGDPRINLHNKLERRSRKLLARKIISRAIMDLAGEDYPNRVSARRYLRSADFEKDIKVAAYPSALLDAVKSAMLLSSAGQEVALRKIVKFLSKGRNKKAPEKTGA